jgi:hypothetical protein
MYTLKKEILNDRPRRKEFKTIQSKTATSIAEGEDLDFRDHFPLIFEPKLECDSVSAVLQLMQFILRRTVLSRNFTRYMQQSQGSGEDTLESAISTLTQTGCCLESTWPSQLEIQRPSDKCYEEAMLYKISHADHIEPEENVIKACLRAGHPIAMGLAVFSSFDTVDSSGLVSIPLSNETSLGNCALVLCGYRESTRHFLALNSNGAEWGFGGACWIPYDYICNPEYIATDLWRIDCMFDQSSPLSSSAIVKPEIIPPSLSIGSPVASKTTTTTTNKPVCITVNTGHDSINIMFAENDDSKSMINPKIIPKKKPVPTSRIVHPPPNINPIPPAPKPVSAPDEVQLCEECCSCFSSCFYCLKGAFCWCGQMSYWCACCCGYGPIIKQRVLKGSNKKGKHRRNTSKAAPKETKTPTPPAAAAPKPLVMN